MKGTDMRIAITGANGLLGRALAQDLSAHGHQVSRIVRGRAQGEVYWDPDRGQIDAEKLEGHDAVFHLAGAGLADRRWTPARKRELWESRVGSTAVLCNALAGLRRPPAVLICASGVGFYGGRAAGERVIETSPPGADFLGQLCGAWEAASAPAQEAGIRVAHLRFGNVLTARGGFLGRLLPLFRLGLGGKLGSGKQEMSWIAIDDLLAIARFLVARGDTAGPYNVTAPACMTNAELTRGLARALRRPALFTVPAFVIRLVFGEMGDALLLSGQCAVPGRLQALGYAFRLPTIDAALNSVV
jgi:uncharacterized protein (TIGR01777 family)